MKTKSLISLGNRMFLALGLAVVATSASGCIVHGTGRVGTGAGYYASGPTMAPPPAQVENVGMAPVGQVWINGRWDWQGGQWTCVEGHWEAQRQGYDWQAGRWEQQGNSWHYVDGQWVVAQQSASVGGGVVAVNAGNAQGGAVVVDRSDRGGNVMVNGGGAQVGVVVNGGATNGTILAGTGPSFVVVGGVQYPTMAPPAPRQEQYSPRPGYIWVAGAYKWDNGQYSWMPGHWERARANAQWTPGRWEQRNNYWVWVEGGWNVGASGSVNVNVNGTAGGTVVRDHR